MRLLTILLLVVTLPMSYAQALGQASRTTMDLARYALKDAAGDSIASLAGRSGLSVSDINTCRIQVMNGFERRAFSTVSSDVRFAARDLLHGQIPNSFANTDMLNAANEIYTFIERSSPISACMNGLMAGRAMTSECSVGLGGLKEYAMGVILKMPQLSAAVTELIKTKCGVEDAK